MADTSTPMILACTGCGKCTYCTARGITAASVLGLPEEPAPTLLAPLETAVAAALARHWNSRVDTSSEFGPEEFADDARAVVSAIYNPTANNPNTSESPRIPDHTTTGQRITAARKAKHLSQDGLAQILGVAQPAINRWESDTQEPQLHNIIPLANALGVTVESLLPGTQPITRNLSAQHVHDLLTFLRDTANQLEQLIT